MKQLKWHETQSAQRALIKLIMENRFQNRFLIKRLKRLGVTILQPLSILISINIAMN